ncbi:MAG: hypothetical protein JWN70_5891 [Planctomycetaceae bacterium]|nr:hypothetical protein [Planctomycetaceae bacterium]
MSHQVSRVRQVALRLALLLILGLALSSATFAGEKVVIHLINGRTITGVIDSHTNDRELWVHSTDLAIAVYSSVRWTEVASADVDQKSLSPQEIYHLAQRSNVQIPAKTFLLPSPANSSSVPTKLGPHVNDLEILPTLANWDADAEPDGLEVRLTTTANNPAVSGLVTIRLMGQRLGTTERLESRRQLGFYTNGGSVREYAPRHGYSRYVEINRWTERLQARNWVDSRYVLRLPFRNVHPEHDLDIAVDGQVDAHLNVQGQRVYNASSPIRLRTYSPLREELQLYRGTRSFPDELVGR